jgi:hypothetical protein
VQTDAAKQPKIVSAGVYLGEVDFLNGTSTFLETNNSDLANLSELSLFSVLEPVTASINEFAISAGSIVNSTGNYGGWALWANGFADRLDFTTQAKGSGTNTRMPVETSSNTSPVVYSAILNGTDGQASVNAVLGTPSTSMITPNNTDATRRKLRLGCQYTFTPASFYSGAMKEVILYTSDQSDNRTALEANIGEVYGIAGIPAYDDTVNGFVETWYDQSGNGNNATQLTAANQPKIVDGGTLVTGGLDFDGADFFNTSLVPPSAATLIGVATWDGVGGMIVGARDSTDERSYISRSGATSELILGVGPDGLRSGSVTLGDEYLAFGTYSGTTANASLNGVNTAFTGITAPVNTTYGYRIGTLNSFGANVATMDGRIREVIIYPSDQSANRPAIEANINNQYEIY